MSPNTPASGIELRLVTDQAGIVYVLPRALLDLVRVPEEYQDGAREVLAGAGPRLLHALAAGRPAGPTSTAFLAAITQLQSVAIRAAQSRADATDPDNEHGLLQLLNDPAPLSARR